MKYSFIITSSILLSLVGISALALNYAFDYSPFELIFFRGVLALFLIAFFIKQYVAQTIAVNSLQGFISYFLNFISILFLSSFLNLFLEYSIYNHIDPEYKYQLEEKEYQKVYEHRMKKGLPLNSRISNSEIEQKYGLVGLVEINQPVYVLNFVTVLLMYLVALFFNHIKSELKTAT
jgi:hypothetical protein